MDEAHLVHGGGQWMGEFDVFDARCLAQQRTDLLPLVGGEIGADPRPEVGGLAHIEDVAGGRAEDVDTRRARQGIGEAELGGLRMAGHRGKGHEVVETGDSQAAGSLDEQVQQVAGGEHIVEGAVCGSVFEVEAFGERAQLAVGDLVAHEAAGEGHGVDRSVGQARSIVSFERGLHEAEVEAHVVPDHHGIADELEQRREHVLDARRREHHRLGDAGEHGDLRGDGAAGIDEGLEGAETFAPSIAGGADLGDAAAGR